MLSEKGAIYATFFLWDQETAKLVETNKVRWSFSNDCGTHRIADANKERLAVAFYYDFLCQAFEKNGLYIDKEVRGQWRHQVSTGQDILVLRKKSSG